MALRPRLTRNVVFRFVSALVREIVDDDLPGMSAEMAYRFLFAIFPLLLFTTALLGVIGGPLGRDDLVLDLNEGLRPLLPPPVAQFVEGFVARLTTERSAAFLTIGLLGTLWGAAGGIGALIKGLNRAYDVVRPRPTWRRQFVAIAATVLVPPIGFALLLVSLAGHSLSGWLGATLGISNRVGELLILQGPATFLIFLAGMALVYATLPAAQQRLRDVFPGGVVATLGWFALTQTFGVYVGNIDQYQVTYGSFAAVIAFLLWLYLVSLVVLVGAEVNALLSPAGRRAWIDKAVRE